MNHLSKFSSSGSKNLIHENTPLNIQNKSSGYVSVITICYNIKDEIERTCKSIIEQTCQDFEWIVVDGGSTDGTLEILEKYKHRINIFISEADSGIYNAMNKGIKRASGKFLIFMNGGDCFADIDIIEEFKNLDGIYDYADIIYGNSMFNGKEVQYPYPLTKQYFYNQCINHQSSFIKKELFDKYGYYDEKYKIISDWQKWVVFIINHCEFVHWNKTVAVFDAKGVSSNEVAIKKELKEANCKYFLPNELNQTIDFSVFGIKIAKIIHDRTKMKIKFLSINIITYKNAIDKKAIKFFGIPILKIKTDINTTKVSLLGIPMFQIKKKNEW